MNRDKITPPQLRVGQDDSSREKETASDEINTTIPLAPANWMTLSAGLKKLRDLVGKNVDESQFEPYLDGAIKHLGEKHFLKEARHRKVNRVHAHYSPEAIEMAIASYRDEREMAPMAPENWMTIRAVQDLLKTKVGRMVRPTAVKSYLDAAVKQLVGGHYLDKARHRRTGRQDPHYSPEAVTAAIEAFENRVESVPLAPKNWLTGKAATAQLASVLDYPATEEKLKPYLDAAVKRLGEEQHYLKEARYIQGGEKAIPHYSPEAVAAAIGAYQEDIPFAPENWITPNAAATQLSVVLGKRVHPPKFKLYLDAAVKQLEGGHYLENARRLQGAGKSYPHYSPEALTAAIAAFREDEENVPKEWMTLGVATAQLRETVGELIAPSTFEPYLKLAVKSLGQEHYFESSQRHEELRNHPRFPPPGCRRSS